jgi:RNA polymerase sigma factor FliA
MDRHHLLKLSQFVQLVVKGKFNQAGSECSIVRAANIRHSILCPVDLQDLSRKEAVLMQSYDYAVRRHATVLNGHISSQERHHPDLKEKLGTAIHMAFINALDNCDPSGGSVNSYVTMRIRGGARDEARAIASQNGIPRSLSSVRQKLDGVHAAFQARTGLEPTAQELVAAAKSCIDLDISTKTALEYLIHAAGVVRLDSTFESNESDGAERHSEVAQTTFALPSARLAEVDAGAFVEAATIRLPEAQRRIVALYNFEELRLREIAEVFGLVESRICQIYDAAKMQLAAILKEQLGKREFEDLNPGVFGKRSEITVSNGELRAVAPTLQNHLRQLQIETSTPGFDEVTPVRAPGIRGGARVRGEELFARKLHALLPTTLHLNRDFLSFLPSAIQSYFDVSAAEIAAFVKATHMLITGEDRVHGFEEGVAPRCLTVCWPLIAARCGVRGRRDLGVAFDTIAAVYALQVAIGGKYQIPVRAMELLESLQHEVPKADIWHRLAERFLLVKAEVLGALKIKSLARREKILRDEIVFQLRR